MILPVNKEVFLRPFFGKNDRPTLRRWFRDSAALKLFCGSDSPETISMMAELAAYNNGWGTFIISGRGLSVGFLQTEPFDSRQLRRHGYPVECRNVVSLDLFIGEENFRGQGLGCAVIDAAAEYLKNQKNTEKIVLDTWPWHKQAIRCYEKSGFRSVRMLMKHDSYDGRPENCLLMERDLSTPLSN